MFEQTVQAILNSRVYEAAVETPLTKAHFLSKRSGNNILIKREDLQSVFSFKLRGAYNCMAHLSDTERKYGVVAASAGNHAQGVAFSGTRLGISSKIVMPATTPEIKIVNVRERGGEVLLYGDTFDQALVEALRIGAVEKRTFIHPYDDPYVIAGQGTIGMEILRQHSGPLKAVFVPVGGGGLIAGIAAYLKYLRPEIKIIAVESEESACLKAALKAKERIRLPRVGIFADGVAVAQIGEKTFEILRECVDDVVTVSNDEICAAIKDLFEETRSIAEPAGALSLAGLKKYALAKAWKNENLLCVMSGANMDFGRLKFISDRADLGEKREALFGVRIPEKKGSFKDFMAVLDGHNITEFCYRYSDSEEAQVLVGVHLSDTRSERAKIVAKLEKNGYGARDFTDDELTKSHISGMVGGHFRDSAQHEYLFEVSFPERCGALAHFLDVLNGRWNLSLFHYRNQGGWEGRVLLGFQVMEGSSAYQELIRFLDRVGYGYTNVSENEAYHQFLR